MSENEAKKFFEKAIENYNEKKFDLAEKNFESALNLSPRSNFYFRKFSFNLSF